MSNVRHHRGVFERVFSGFNDTAFVTPQNDTGGSAGSVISGTAPDFSMRNEVIPCTWSENPPSAVHLSPRLCFLNEAFAVLLLGSSVVPRFQIPTSRSRSMYVHKFIFWNLRMDQLCEIEEN